MLALVREIYELIEAEAREALDSGWAELRMEESEVGPSLHLEPIKLSAAPLEVFFDSEELALCSPGRKGMSVEFFAEDPGEIRDKVLALAAAVVGGHYVERYRTETSALEALWPGPSGEEKGTREALIPSSLGPEGWRTLAYEAY
jgi:hypothetical protein